MNVTDNFSPNSATLYYDGRCSICAKEMQRLEKMKSSELELVDIHKLEPVSGLPDAETLLRTLHLRLSDGQFLTGVDANIAAWNFTRIGPLFRWMKWPIIAPIFDIFYTRWTRWRYERLYNRPCPAENI